MNNRAKTPKKWANDLTIVLNALGDEERFPVKIKQLAIATLSRFFQIIGMRTNLAYTL